MLVLYGRRRVGKTALLTQWIQQSGQPRADQGNEETMSSSGAGLVAKYPVRADLDANASNKKRAIYWVAAPNSALAQLRSFSQAIYNFANPEAPAPETFAYVSWEQAWQQVAKLAQSERLVLFIDEFTYLLEVTPGIAGELQNFWDSTLSHCNLFLCLSGSHLGMMKREFLSYQAPLYGRASNQLHLQPLPFGVTKNAFPRYSAVDRVGIYAMFGGIPAYWERIDPRRSVSDNIKNQVLTAGNLMQSEPRLLLQDFISEPHNYVAVLTAIANGARTPAEIASFTGLPNVQAPKYLSVLADAGFVERRAPVTASPSSRLGRHHVTDPYLRFYFRFLASRQEQLALGLQDQALAEISRHLIDFIGTYTWEELCREWVLRAASAEELFLNQKRSKPALLPDKVGSAWSKHTQVDVVGINRMQKTLILGECKWTLSPVKKSVLSDLIEKKTAHIIPKDGRWQVFYLGFARSGWSAEAQAYEQEINQAAPSGANWQAAGMRLLDLEQVDDDLARWAG